MREMPDDLVEDFTREPGGFEPFERSFAGQIDAEEAGGPAFDPFLANL